MYGARLFKRRRKGWAHVVREHGGSEFNREGVGHPPCWASDGVHGCDGGCSRPDFPGRIPVVGDIAVCGSGIVGMIIQDGLQDVTYPDGNTARAYVGVKVTSRGVLPCSKWSSRNPCIIGTLDDLKEKFRWSIESYVRSRAVPGWPLKWER